MVIEEGKWDQFLYTEASRPILQRGLVINAVSLQSYSNQQFPLSSERLWKMFFGGKFRILHVCGRCHPRFGYDWELRVIVWGEWVIVIFPQRFSKSDVLVVADSLLDLEA